MVPEADETLGSPAAAVSMPGDIGEKFTVPGSWRFTEDVAENFDEHVHHSVPFYDQMQDLVASICDWLAPNGAVVADLGASTGTTVHLIARRHPERSFTFWLYDQQTAMLEQAQRKLEDTQAQCFFRNGRLEDGLEHDSAHLTLILFTLQFIEPCDRPKLLREARKRTRDGGALLLAEKLRLTDPRWQEIAISSSHDFKAACGISDTAIRAKERALRGVLVPMRDQQQRTMLADSGWRSVETLFRWHQWVLYGAFA